MAVAITHQVEVALALKTKFTGAFSQHQQFQVVLRLEILKLQRVGGLLFHRTLVDSLHQVESLLQCHHVAVVGSGLH